MRIVLALLLVLACSDASEREPLVVFAASSTTEAFEALAQAYEEAHPEVDVQLTFAGSHVLRLQIEHGAPAEVFASADPEQTRALEQSGALRSPHVFARNELALIVPNRPGALASFDELDEVRSLVVGAPSVPVGRYTARLLERTRATHGDAFVDAVRAAIASEESNVRLVRAKVELGEADAAFVYSTDVTPSVRALPIPESLQESVDHTIGVTNSRGHREADAFVAFVLGPDGQAILERHGFRVEGP